MWTFIKDRLTEKSSWVSLFSLLATIGGVNLAPDLKEAIIAMGMAVLTLVGILTKQEKK